MTNRERPIGYRRQAARCSSKAAAIAHRIIDLDPNFGSRTKSFSVSERHQTSAPQSLTNTLELLVKLYRTPISSGLPGAQLVDIEPGVETIGPRGSGMSSIGVAHQLMAYQAHSAAAETRTIFRAICTTGVCRSAVHLPAIPRGIVEMSVAAGVSMMKRSPHAKVAALPDRPKPTPTSGRPRC
jgi:hypothetical protein